jgi:tRNA (guanine-N7-)-methyltransferase
MVCKGLIKENHLSRPNKLKRYAENKESSNVVDPAVDTLFPGRWSQEYFHNDRPITLELACGRGEYTLGLGAKQPERNFIGVDLKGDRIWKGSQQALKQELSNVAFVRGRIEFLPAVFAPNEIDEIWLTFPDPRPRDREEKHRLTHLTYLNLYQSLLHHEGWFRFKTDNTPLFDYTLEILSGLNIRDLQYTFDLYTSGLREDHHGLKTKYEDIWTRKGETIKYLKCKFNHYMQKV